MNVIRMFFSDFVYPTANQTDPESYSFANDIYSSIHLEDNQKLGQLLDNAKKSGFPIDITKPVGKGQYSLIQEAIYKDSYDLVNTLFTKGTHPTSFNFYEPCVYAVFNGRSQSVKALCEHVDFTKLTSENIPMGIDLLIKSIQAIINLQSEYFLPSAMSLFYLLLDANKSQINATTWENGTVLHTAASSGNKDIIEALIKAGADPSVLKFDQTKVPQQSYLKNHYGGCEPVSALHIYTSIHRNNPSEEVVKLLTPNSEN